MLHLIYLLSTTATTILLSMCFTLPRVPGHAARLGWLRGCNLYAALPLVSICSPGLDILGNAPWMLAPRYYNPCVVVVSPELIPMTISLVSFLVSSRLAYSLRIFIIMQSSNSSNRQAQIILV